MSICIKDQIQNMNLVIGCTVGCDYCYARNNVKRWHMTEDFTNPEYFPSKIKLMERKRPDLLDFETDLENAWFGVTVTRRSEAWRIEALRKNIRAKHYHVTFEPLFEDPGEIDLTGIDWIVVGTMTGAQSKKIHTKPEWAHSLIAQAHKMGIPAFMKEDLVPIIGEENMVQELPEAFLRVLEEQKAWNK